MENHPRYIAFRGFRFLGAHRDEIGKLGTEPFCNPRIPRVRLKLLPRDVADVFARCQEVKRFVFRHRRRFVVVENTGGARVRLFHKDADTHADLDAEDVGGARLSLADIAAHVKQIQRVKILGEMLPHAVKRLPGDEVVIRHKRDDALAANSLQCPEDCFDVGIVEHVCVR